MELNLQRQTITMNEVVFDGHVEQPIECDALLPDYCPDIVKILKCAVVTHIGSTAVSGDHLTIEGVAIAHIYYASDSSEIRHAEYKIPFAKTVDLRTAPNMPVVTVTPSVDYVNCRAVNQRRIDVRGALSLAVKVTDRREEKIISDAQGCGIQLRRGMVRCTEMLGQSESNFTVSEELELGYGKAPIQNIVRCDCRVNVHDYKIIAGKVVAKGDFLLHLCYQPSSGANRLEVMEYSLPISQIIDSDATDENCICDVEMYVTSCDAQPKPGDDGECRAVTLDAKVRVVVTSHRHQDVPVASDCYSTQYECKGQSKNVSFLYLSDVVREVLMHKVTLDLPENVDCVLDAWCEVENLTWKHEPGELALALQLKIGMFAQMEDGECSYFEQGTDMEQRVAISADCDDVSFEPTCDILSCAYNLVGKEKIDIRCETLVKGCVYCMVRSNALDEISVDETKPKQKEKARLCICYADAGESVWDIAKHYNTSANAIWEENAIENDVLPNKRMLLIPIV